MRAGGFPGNPGGLVVSIVKTAGGRAPAHQARGRGRCTWRPTERSRRCSDGTAGRRQRSAGGWAARSRSVSEYRRSGGIEPTRPRGGKGAPAGGTGGGKDGQHTEVGSRTTLSRSRMRQNPHVRICGGPGSATTLAYPTGRWRQRRLRMPSFFIPAIGVPGPCCDVPDQSAPCGTGVWPLRHRVAPRASEVDRGAGGIEGAVDRGAG